MGLWKQKRAAIEEERETIEIAFPERVTSREYYGALVGLRFDDDLAAAEHYLADGWREGVLPHPFLDRPLVRSSMDAAVRLRDELREFARFAEAHPDLGELAGIIDLTAMPEADRLRFANDAAAFLRAPQPERDSAVVRGGKRWGDVRKMLAESTHVVPRMESTGMFDLEHYANGRSFLGWRAGLDDYLVTGEGTGATPNWAFDAEWYASKDRSQTPKSRSFNQLFHYVADGERTSTTPADATGRSLAELLALGEADEVQPVGGGSVRVDAVKAAIRSARIRAIKPRPGRKVPLRGGEPFDVAVIVDSRHLVAEAHYADLITLAQTQDVEFRKIFVVCDADDGHEPPLETRFTEERFEFRYSPMGTSFGAAAASIVEEGSFAAWTLWRPGQQWKPSGLSDASRALDANPDSAGVGAYTPQAPQEWADLEGTLWGSRLDAAGIVFRTDRIAPNPERDYGLNADAVARLAIEGDGIVIERDRFWSRGYDGGVFANRAAANSARKSHLPIIECTVPTDAAATVIIPTFEDWRMTLDAVRAVRADGDAGVIIVDNGSRATVGALLIQAFAADPYVQYVRLPSNTDFATASDYGARIATTDVIVFLNNDTVVQTGWLTPLLNRLETAAAVQPLLLFADRTVQSAGTIFAGGLAVPRHLLTGFHIDDVPASIADYPFSALTAACLAVRRQDYLDVGGFEAEYVNGMEDVDFCLRLRSAKGRALHVVLDSHVLHLESKTAGRFSHVSPNRLRLSKVWRNELLSELDDRAVLDGTPLRVAEVRWADQQGGVLREPEWRIEQVHTPIQVSESAPRLRWAVKASSPGSVLGDLWGDTFYAQDLAEALQRLGQHVVVDRTSSWNRVESSGWDDVTVALRGLRRFTPQPDAVNLMWVISHPDQVTVDELCSGWDHVYAAGPAWAEAKSAHAGVAITPLLQATAPRRFRPVSPRTGTGGVLFVGRTRGERRHVVIDAAAVSDDLEVYGDDGWERYIDSHHIRAAVLPNAELPDAYAGARVVLNDHWDDMRRGGFLSNRLFDAAASGARIVSDDVVGLHEVFGDQVRTYTSREELAALLSADAEGWPSDDDLRASAARIAQEHSFDARARVLLDDALRLGAGRDRP